MTNHTRSHEVIAEPLRSELAEALTPVSTTKELEALVVNHDEAHELAQMKRESSNLARCYLDVESKLEASRSHVAALVKSVSEANALLTAATERARELEKRLDSGNYCVECGWTQLRPLPALPSEAKP